jgi:hypothetical protein
MAKERGLTHVRDILPGMEGIAVPRPEPEC